MPNLTAFAMLLGLQIVSLGCLALSQARHWRMLIGPTRSPATAPLRWLGGAGLMTSLPLAVNIFGCSFGGIVWLLSLPLGGYAVAFGLAANHSTKQRQAKRAASSIRKSCKP